MPRKEVVPLSLEVIIIIRVNVIELFIKVFHPMLPFRNIVIQKLIIYENRESTRNVSVTSNYKRLAARCLFHSASRIQLLIPLHHFFMKVLASFSAFTRFYLIFSLFNLFGGLRFDTILEIVIVCGQGLYLRCLEGIYHVV